MVAWPLTERAKSATGFGQDSDGDERLPQVCQRLVVGQFVEGFAGERQTAGG